MTTPRTEAGRALVKEWRGGQPYIVAAVLAIEAEATENALLRVAELAAAEAAPLDVESDEWCIATCPLDSEPHRHLTAKGSRT